MKQRTDIAILIGLLFAILVLFIANLISGDVSISFSDVMAILGGEKGANDSWSYIVENRLNRSIVAIGAGGALALSGLMLQVFFRNPLAGPGVLGVTSGASLGVATIILGGLSGIGFWHYFGAISAGLVGAFLVLLLLLIVSKFIRNAITLLVVGLMFGYFTSAIINVLYLWADKTDTRAYIVWNLGSFQGLERLEMWFFSGIIVLVTLISFILVKPLNALVIGEDYAITAGTNMKRTRMIIIGITGLLAAIVTVYCGPISFIGIAVPQLIRLIIKSKNHAVIIPLTFVGGSFLAILSDYIVRLSGSSIPLNTVTALIGAPIIVAIIVKMNKRNVSV